VPARGQFRPDKNGTMLSTNGDAGNSGKDRNDAMKEIAAGSKSIARAINPAIFKKQW
jgi:hypothetical protein